MKGHCPGCGNESVKYSAKLHKSLYRWLVRSRKRFCPKCGARWRVEGKVTLLDSLEPAHVLIILMSIIAAMMVAGINLTGQKKPFGRHGNMIRIDQVYDKLKTERLR